MLPALDKRCFIGFFLDKYGFTNTIIAYNNRRSLIYTANTRRLFNSFGVLELQQERIEKTNSRLRSFCLISFFFSSHFYLNHLSTTTVQVVF